MSTRSSGAKPGRWATLLWVTIGLQSLTYCSGSTETGGGGKAGQGGTSYAGHTAGCLPCCQCAVGGTPNDGAGGTPAGGTPNMSGANFGGFAGHTAGCIGNPCSPNCPGFFSPACAGAGGIAGDANMGAAGEAGMSAGGEGSAPAAKASFRPLPGRACYALAGYEPDPCLPADDSLVPWLGGIPGGCDAAVVAGPVYDSGPEGRQCCYSVVCRERAE